MSLEEVFSSGSKPVLMTHVYYGDPSPEFSLQQVRALAEGGADIIELGIPFSDPTADGPVFQRACARALKNGITPDDVINGVRQIRQEGITAPIVITTYYNIIHRMGTETFIRRIKDAGADGVIVPNLPLEESDELLEAANEVGIHVILLAAPTTTGHRLETILKKASGFLYLVSVAGVTGARDKVAGSTLELVSRVRSLSDIPLLVGFGISAPGHARAVVEAGADGVIVGSAIGRIYEENLTEPQKTLAGISEFTAGIKDSCIDIRGLSHG